MAEIVKTVKIETGSGERSVKSLKKEISDLRDALLNMDKGGEEWKKTADELTKAQEDLNSVMKAGKEAADADATSIAGMEARYKSLYQTYRLLSDEQRKTAKGISMQKELAELSKNLNSTKKDAGNFKDNIGHYADDMMSAFGQLGISIGNLQGPLKMATQGTGLFKKALDVLKAHPILGVLAILIGLFNKVRDAIKGNEELQLRMNKVMAAFKPIGDAVAIALDKIAGVAVTVAEGIAKVVTWITNLTGASKKLADAEADVAEKENQLIKERREIAELNAEDNAHLQTLLEEANTTEDIVQKEQKLREARELQEKINERNIALKQKELDVIKEINAITPSSTEDLDKESAAQVALNNTRAEGEKALKKIDSQLKSTTKAGQSAADSAKKELDEILKRLEDNSKTEIQKLTEKYEKEKALLVKYHKDTTKLEAEYQKNLRTIEVNSIKDTVMAQGQYLNTTLGYLVDPSNERFDMQLEIIKARGKSLTETLGKLFGQGDNGHFKIQSDQIVRDGELTAEANAMNEMFGLGLSKFLSPEENEKLFNAFIESINVEYAKVIHAQNKWNREIKENWQDNTLELANAILITTGQTDSQYYAALAVINEKEREILAERLERAEKSYNKIKDLNEAQLNEQGLTLNDQLDREREYYEAKAALRDKDLEAEIAKRDKERELEQDKIDALHELKMTSLDSMNSIIETTKTLIDAYKKDGEISEKEAKRKADTLKWLEGIQGAVAVAGIVADTASGWMAINRALAQEYILNAQTAAATGPAAVATKAALDAKSLITANIRKAVLLVNGTTAAAAAVGKTIANIKALGADTGDGGTGGAGSATATPALIESTPYSYTRELQTNVEREEMLNTPIYVRVTDIDAAQARVKVTNREVTW